MQKKKNPRTKNPTAISYTLEKGELQKHFSELVKTWSIFNILQALHPSLFFYTWVTILCPTNDRHKFYCMHRYIKHFQNLSSTFSLALCALSRKISAQFTCTSAEPRTILAYASITACLWKRQKPLRCRCLKTSGSTNILLGGASLLHSRHIYITFWSRLLEFVPEHKPPFSKLWS